MARMNELSAASEPGIADLGYSLTNGSNALADLKQLVHNKDGTDAISTAPSYPVEPSATDSMLNTFIARLPSRIAMSKLVAAFFDNVNWHYSILEKYYFDYLFAKWCKGDNKTLPHLDHEEMSKELHYFPALLFQVLGLTVQFLPFDSHIWEYLSSADLNSAPKYSDIGMELMTHLKKANVALTVVQTQFLRASWLKNIGKGTEAWHSVRDAIQSAQELELHRRRDLRQQGPRSTEVTLSRVWYEEYQRRLWMNLCVWDTLTAMILGRPRTINPDDCDMEEPLECNIPQDPSTSILGTKEGMMERDRPNTVSQNLFLYRLCGIWHTVKALKADRSCYKDYFLIQTLHNRISEIMDQLPPTLRSENPDNSWDDEFPHLNQQREDILTKANLILMALHRPHIEQYSESRRAALQAAITILESQSRSFMDVGPHQYKLFGLSFYTIDASLLLSVVAAKHPPQKDSELMISIDHILRQAMNRLWVMYSYSPIARSGLAIIRQCYHVLRQSWQSNCATLDASVRVTIEPKSVKKRVNIDETADNSTERQPQSLRDPGQPRRQQTSTSSAPGSSPTEDSTSTLPTSSQSSSSQNEWRFDAGIDKEFIPTPGINESLSTGPSTTCFDEAYWMNLLNETSNSPIFGAAEHDGIDGVLGVTNMGYDSVWDDIQLID